MQTEIDVKTEEREVLKPFVPRKILVDDYGLTPWELAKIKADSDRAEKFLKQAKESK